MLPLVVRPLDDAHEVIGGNQQLKVYQQQGAATVPCVEVEADDTQARLLAQALNAVHGEDDLNRKSILVRDLLAAMNVEEVAAILPDTADTLRGLASLGQQQQDAGTLADALTAWEKAKVARLELRAYEAVLAVYVQAVGDVHAVLRSGLAPATRRQRYAILRAFGAWAVKKGHLARSPVDSIPPPRLPQGQPRAIPADDLERLARVVGSLPLAHQTMFTLLVETALREVGAVGRCARDVDLATAGGEGLHVRGKGDRERFVPLPPGHESRRFLRRLIRGLPAVAPVFSADGDRPWTASTVRKVWGRVCSKAGVRHRVDDLRHTAATRIGERLGDTDPARRLLGHASFATTALYTQRDQAALRHVMDGIGGGWQR